MPNRLAFEDSPYLQQHKDNLFDWYPWCDEAFEKAKNENKPIFISIGYSSCHWCHVMEKEVFKNETIAAYVNENFVCIKVDREERPDIDKHYQQVHKLLNRRTGGWPLSIFCTPQNKPFHTKTYILPYNRDQMMGFSELSAIIAQKVGDKDEKLFQNADEISSFLHPKNEPVQAAVLDLKIASLFLKQAQYNFDTENGGFSSAPKFPHVSTLETLMCLDRLNPSETARRIVTHTLGQMALGGMYDLVDGGFCRYSTDASWLLPHFEKMGYDNALLCSLYAKAALAYKNDSFAFMAKDIADFMMKFMMENDLFYSSSNADTDGEEGKYYVFSYHEILTALRNAGLDDQQLEEALSIVGASPNGNYKGHTIIRLSSHNKPKWFETFRYGLQSIRSKRTYPFIDTKVITAWNAMMIRGLFFLGKIDHTYTETAIRSLDALLRMMLRNDKLFHCGLVHKEPKIEAFLEDYAYLCSALLEAYEATLDEIYLVRAQLIANKALELFYNQGSWYFSLGDFATRAELDDETYPSPLAIMIESLLILGQLIDEKYRRFAFKTLEYHSMKLMKTPIYYPKFVEQVVRFLNPVRIVKVPQQLRAKRPVFITYPFALYSVEHSGKEFMICDENSCFAQTQNPSLLDDLIKSSL